MEFYGRILILFLVSGVIAWVGDRVGQHFGKRKATAFGLRPRATSRLIAILTGILVMAASVCFMSLVSNDFRDAFINLERIQRENREAAEEVRDVRTELADLRRQENAAREDLGRVRGDLDDARGENSELVKENVSLVESNRGLRAENEILVASNARLDSENRGLKGENRTLEKSRDELQAEIDRKVRHDPLHRAGHYVSRGVFALPPLESTERESLAAEFRNSLEIELAAFGTSEKAAGVSKIVPPGESDIADAVDQLMLLLTVADEGVRQIILDLVPKRSVWKGDPLELGIEIHLNFEVFPAGKVLALRQISAEAIGDEGELRQIVRGMYREAAQLGADQGILPSEMGGVVAVSNLALEEYIKNLHDGGKPGVLSLVTRAPIKCNSILSGANLGLEFKPYQPESP